MQAHSLLRFSQQKGLNSLLSIVLYLFKGRIQRIYQLVNLINNLVILIMKTYWFEFRKFIFKL